MNLKIIFIGTPRFGAIVLEELTKSFPPCLVITHVDKKFGREQILKSPEVKIAAENLCLPVLQTENIKSNVEDIRKLKPDLIVVAAFDQIIPKSILDIPKSGSLNVHPSLLPKYRGPSPIQFAVLSGDTKTGVTIMKMNEKMDQGEIVSKKEIEIDDKDSYIGLLPRLAELGGLLLIQTIPLFIEGKIKLIPQNEKEATYTKILKKEDGHIDFNLSALEIERMVRAFNPFPSSHCFLDSKTLKIFKASVLKQNEAGPFGVIGKTFLATNNEIAVQTGKDFLVIQELQIEGKKRMKTEEFLRGNLKLVGQILS